MGAMRSASPTKASQHLFGRRHRVRRRERGDERSRSPQDRHAFELDLTLVSYRQIAIAIAQNHLTGIADRLNHDLKEKTQLLDRQAGHHPTTAHLNYNWRADNRRGSERRRSPQDQPRSGCITMRPQERRHDSNRSLLPGTDTYYGSGERQAFKKRDEKT